MDCKFNFNEEVAMSRFRCPSFKSVVYLEEEDVTTSFHSKKWVKMNQSWAVGYI